METVAVQWSFVFMSCPKRSEARSSNATSCSALARGNCLWKMSCRSENPHCFDPVWVFITVYEIQVFFL